MGNKKVMKDSDVSLGSSSNPISPTRDYRKFSQLGNARYFATPYKRLHTRLIHTAKYRGIPCELTYEDYLKFTKKKVCHYCHAKLKWVKNGSASTSINIDRKNHKKGYVKGNCVASCTKCNMSRGRHFTYRDWLGMCEFLRKKREKK